MNHKLYVWAAALAAACLTAGLVILVGRPSSPLVSAAPTATATASAAASLAATAPPATTAVVTPLRTAAPNLALTSPATGPQQLRVSVPALPAVKQTDAMAVAQTVIAAMYSIDTAVDSDPTGGARRGAYLMTPTLAAALTAPPSTGSGVRWQQWESARAYVTVTSRKINIPWTVADNRLTVIRNIGFIQTVHTTTGTAALPQQTLAVRLVRAADGQPWRVDTMETP